MKILVSACLMGVNCKYNGENNADPNILALAEKHNLIPICPEQLGGLPTPRIAAEISDSRVVTASGEDVTAEFQKGAAETLRLAKLLKADAAILKAKSPSCGNKQVYDGTFTHALIPGSGLTAQALMDAGIQVLSELEI